MRWSKARGRRDNKEGAGFLVSAAFVGLASVRDVYLGGLFQSLSPVILATVAFSLCFLVFFPIALVATPESLRRMARRPGELFWINATSALGWLAFFHALQMVEPLLVQILFAGVGPLSVVSLDRFVGGEAPVARPSRIEVVVYLGLLVSLGFAVVVAVAGISGLGPQPAGLAFLGVSLATTAGVSISINTVLCRRMNDTGVNPVALVAVRFLGTVTVAAALALVFGHGLTSVVPRATLAVVAAASLLLVVLPIYVNQIGVSLASPLTVRVVLALAPVLIFVLQLSEGRLPASPYSLAAAVLYGTFAITGAVVRRRALGGRAT